MAPVGGMYGRGSPAPLRVRDRPRIEDAHILRFRAGVTRGVPSRMAAECTGAMTSLPRPSAEGSGQAFSALMISGSSRSA